MNAGPRRAALAAALLALPAFTLAAAYPPTGGPMHPSWKSVQAKNGRHLAYVSTFAGGTVQIFSQNGNDQAPIGELTGLQYPQGLVVDAARNLYVANTGGFDVLVYPPGATVPSRTIDTSAFGYPGDVFVAPNGTLYVGISQTANGGQGMILAYPPVRNAAPLVLQDSINSYHLIGVEADASSDVFVSIVQDDGRGLSVIDYPAHGQGRVLPLTTNFAGGLAFDNAGNLAVVDQGGVGAASVRVYATGKYRKPLYTFGSDMKQPVFLAFDAGSAHAWVTDAGHNVVNVYAYPSGTLVNALTQFEAGGTVDGIALSN